MSPSNGASTTTIVLSHVRVSDSFSDVSSAYEVDNENGRWSQTQDSMLLQCMESYHHVSEPGLLTTDPGCQDGCECGRFFNNAKYWWRFSGDAGDGLSTVAPSFNRCGTASTGWLSGWNPSSGTPPATYSAPGTYPVPAEGVADRVVCFNSGVGDDLGTHVCEDHVVVSVVNCGTFFLWQLPPAPSCAHGFCTTFVDMTG